MRRSLLIAITAAGLFLALVWSAFSAPKGAGNAGRPAPTRASIPILRDPIGGIGPGIGPGYGGTPVPFVGLTTRTFPPGAGALAVSRECNAQYPVSRLCEWRDIFRAIPPVAEFPTEVLVAPSYETNPVPACMNPAGGLRCGPLPLMRPAACCGYPVPPPPPAGLATILLSPSDPQAAVDCIDSFQFTATAFDAQGAPLPGIRIEFAFPPVVGGTSTFAGMGVFNPASAATDANGEVTTILTFVPSACQSLCVGGGDCSAVLVAHDPSLQIVSNPVSVVDNIP